MTGGWVSAVDLGATSGRVMLGRVGPEVLTLTEVHRFPNEPVAVADGLHWSILELYRNVLVGLRKAIGAQPELVGVGIDSWAVDYGLLSGNRLINNPFHYRDERTAHGVDLVHAQRIMARCTRRTVCSSSRSTPSTSWRSTPRLE